VDDAVAEDGSPDMWLKFLSNPQYSITKFLADA
jgi:hypothetical protein